MGTVAGRSCARSRDRWPCLESLHYCNMLAWEGRTVLNGSTCSFTGDDAGAAEELVGRVLFGVAFFVPENSSSESMSLKRSSSLTPSVASFVSCAVGMVSISAIVMSLFVSSCDSTLTGATSSWSICSESLLVGVATGGLEPGDSECGMMTTTALGD